MPTNRLEGPTHVFLRVAYALRLALRSGDPVAVYHERNEVLMFSLYADHPGLMWRARELLREVERDFPSDTLAAARAHKRALRAAN